MPLILALRFCLLLSAGLATACGVNSDRLTATEKELIAMRNLLFEQAVKNKGLLCEALVRSFETEAYS